MSFFLDIAIVLISLALTALGLFGKGWESGERFSLRSINRHGWTSVSRLALATITIVVKEMRTQSEAEKSKLETAQARIALTEAVKDGRETKAQLKVTNQSLQNTQTQLKMANQLLMH